MRFNIYSGSTDGNGLAAALTNPTELSKRKGNVKQDYPVFFQGVTWPDAESAYLTLAASLPHVIKAASPREDCTHLIEDARDKLMIDIIVAKLRQHPRLGQTVRAKGGVAFLERCEHTTNAKSSRFQAWEGYGRESRFIRNLIAAYERWAVDA